MYTTPVFKQNTAAPPEKLEFLNTRAPSENANVVEISPAIVNALVREIEPRPVFVDAICPLLINCEPSRMNCLPALHLSSSWPA
jgi:hypothetical protein